MGCISCIVVLAHGCGDPRINVVHALVFRRILFILSQPLVIALSSLQWCSCFGGTSFVCPISINLVSRKIHSACPKDRNPVGNTCYYSASSALTHLALFTRIGGLVSGVGFHWEFLKIYY